MRRRPLIELAAVVLFAVMSGTLECGGRRLGEAELRGAALYHRMCAVCHGPAGEGYAADHAPALANRAFLASVSDDALRAAISNGRGGTTMSAWSTARGGPLARGDVDALITYLRTWERGPRAALDDRPPGGDVARGRDVFARDCAGCHGAKGTGGPYVGIGGYDLLSTAGNGFLRHAIAGGRPGTPMPAFEREIELAGVDDLVALLRSWQTVGVATRPAPARPPPIPLGPVPLNPHGPEPDGFRAQPAATPADVVKAQLDRGARFALLDARAPSDYLGEHIAGAVSVPFYDPDPYVAALPHNAWLVCYCSCPHAESGQLAQKLASKGFDKVTVLDEGLGVWKVRKYPTRGGLDP
jgi:cytochrome c oxidase cbb3-type subunit 3/ubiquinol-cytochrome c reductase cytochrome c subunit